MNFNRPIRRAGLAGLVLATAALLLPAVALAHARVSPAVSLAGKLQLYSLAVPTEKSGLTTTKLVMTVPSGIGIDSYVPPTAPWRVHVSQTGSGDSAVITKVTLTGGHTPTGEDTLFQFLAQPSAAQTYTFQVEQTYSDGSIVNWAGPESSAAPAPTIQAASSLGGGDWDLYRKVIFPSVLPYIVAASRIAVGRALIGVLVGEFFAASEGIGYAISRFGDIFALDRMFACILTVMVIAVVLTEGIRFAERIHIALAQNNRDDLKNYDRIDNAARGPVTRMRVPKPAR